MRIGQRSTRGALEVYLQCKGNANEIQEEGFGCYPRENEGQNRKRAERIRSGHDVVNLTADTKICYKVQAKK